MGLFDSIGDAFQKVFSWFVDIPKPEQPSVTVNKSSNVAPIPVVYGTRKIGGTRVFMETGDKSSGNNKKNAYLYIALVLCEGEIEAIDDIWIDDKHISEFDSGDYSVSTVGSFASYTDETAVVIRKYLGTDDQTSDSMLQNATGWTSSHRLRGLAYLAIRLKYTDKYFGGLPEITCTVRGRKVLDIRTSPQAETFTDNAALCLRDYLTNSRYGKGLDSTAIDDTAFAAAADDCDTTTTVSSLVTLGTPDLVSTFGDKKYIAWYTTPANAQVLVGATLQTNDSPISKIGVVRQGFSTPGFFGNNGGYRLVFEMTTGSDFTTSDEIFIQGDTHKLFACNAVIDTGESMFNNVKKILSGMRGLMPFIQGQYSVEVEQSKSSSFSFDESHIVGGISVRLPNKQDKYNRVTVKFVNPNANWQEDVAIFPEPGSATETTLLAEDGGTPLYHEVTLETVNNYYQARDLARLILYKSRGNIRCSFKATSEALQLSVGDVVDITHPTPGWSGKLFQIMQMGLLSTGEVTLDLVEHTQSIYTYDSTDPDYLSDDTNLPDPFNVEAPSNLAGTSINDKLFGGLQRAGISLTFDSADDAFVDEYEVQYRDASTSPKGPWRSTFTRETEITLIPLEWQRDWDIRVRTLSTLGVKSDWSATLVHTLGLDTTAPGLPTGITLTPSSDAITVSFTPPSDVDRHYVEVYYDTVNSIPGSPAFTSSYLTNKFVIPDLAAETTYYVWLKSVDDAGNVSAATTVASTTTTTPPTQEVPLRDTSFPTGPYDDGQVLLRTDTGVLYEWDSASSPNWVLHTPPDPSNLRIAGNSDPTSTTFTGEICWFVWDYSSDFDVYKFLIEFWWDGELQYTQETINQSGAFYGRFCGHAWTKAVDVDPDTSSGVARITDGARDFTARVYAMAPDGVTRSTNYTELTVTNDQMPVPTGFTATLTQNGNVVLDWNVPEDQADEFAGVEIHASTSSGFTPSTGSPSTLKRILYSRSGKEEVIDKLSANTTWYIKIGFFDVWGKDGITYSSQQSVTTPANYGTLAYKSAVATGDISNDAVTRAKVAAGELIETTVVSWADLHEASPGDFVNTLTCNTSITAKGSGLIVVQAYGAARIEGLSSFDPTNPPYVSLNIDMKVGTDTQDFIGGAYVSYASTNEVAANEWWVRFEAAGLGTSDYSGYTEDAPSEGDTVLFELEWIFVTPTGETMDDLRVIDPTLIIMEYNNT